MAFSTEAFSKFDSAEYAGTTAETRPFAQILNNYGVLGIQDEQAERVAFNVEAAIKDGWEQKTLAIGDGEKLFYVTPHPRFHIIRTRLHDTGEINAKGRKVLNKVMLVVFVNESNEPLHTAAVQLTLKGGSVASGSFYDLYDNLKQENPCWLKQIWEVKPKANRRFMSLAVIQAILKGETKGTGKQKSKCTKFVTFSPFGEDTFVGFDDAKREYIEALFDETESFNAKRDSKQSDEATAEDEGDDEADY